MPQTPCKMFSAYLVQAAVAAARAGAVAAPHAAPADDQLAAPNVA